MSVNTDLYAIGNLELAIVSELNFNKEMMNFTQAYLGTQCLDSD